MYNTTENKKNPNVIVIRSRKPRTGHPTHRSGAGAHQDRRDRRNRTRSAQMARAISE